MQGNTLEIHCYYVWSQREVEGNVKRLQVQDLWKNLQAQVKRKEPTLKAKGRSCQWYIPHWEREVAAQIKRVSFVSRMWANANKPIIQQHPLVDDGWRLVEDQYKPIWFVGDQLREWLVTDEEKLADADDDKVLAQSFTDEEGFEGNGDYADV